MGAASSLFVILVILVITGCTSSDPEASPAGGDNPGDGPGRPTVTLYVSNQSFADDPVTIEVVIDGETVVDDRFRVENQHTWVEFGLELDPGPHQVVARSSTGVEFTGEIVVPEDDHLWAVIDYWYYPDDLERSFSLRSQTEPIGFD